MKKTRIVILLIVMMFSLSGCKSVENLIQNKEYDKVYQIANKKAEKKQYLDAGNIYEKIFQYQDSSSKAIEMYIKANDDEKLYDFSKMMIEVMDFDNAVTGFKNLKNYKDGKELYECCTNLLLVENFFVVDLLPYKKYINEYPSTIAMVEIYADGMMESGQYMCAINAYSTIKDNGDEYKKKYNNSIMAYAIQFFKEERIDKDFKKLLEILNELPKGYEYKNVNVDTIISAIERLGLDEMNYLFSMMLVKRQKYSSENYGKIESRNDFNVMLTTTDFIHFNFIIEGEIKYDIKTSGIKMGSDWHKIIYKKTITNIDEVLNTWLNTRCDCQNEKYRTCKGNSFKIFINGNSKKIIIKNPDGTLEERSYSSSEY